MADISVLHHQEGVRLDPDRVVALYAELGEVGAEAVMCRSIEELAVQLAALQKAARAADAGALVEAAGRLGRLAEQIGMVSLARVAGDVAKAALGGDAAGMAATLARLVRIGDRSLTAVWDMQDMSL
ncbi:MAG: hypothetical protein CVT82_04120 [Alphaproteobacteria bacterium HGW-Alphaproteobacteria-4]|nr:MAG: hypothetical protein CVT82_04120 [Alphaproteobacteria bacterium HGW-Alphaproteobacteria-4]